MQQQLGVQLRGREERFYQAAEGVNHCVRGVGGRGRAMQQQLGVSRGDVLPGCRRCEQWWGCSLLLVRSDLGSNASPLLSLTLSVLSLVDLNASPLLSLTLSVLSLVDLNANAGQLVRYSAFNDDCLSLYLHFLSLVDLNANASQLVRYSAFNDDCLALSIAYPDDANAAAYSFLSR